MANSIRVASLPKDTGNEKQPAERLIKVKINHFIDEITTVSTTDKTVREIDLGQIKGKAQRNAVQSGQMYIALEAPNLTGLNLRPSAQKLFRLINAGVTSSNYDYKDREKACTVTIPISKAMELCNVKNEKSFLRTARVDLKTLASLGFSEERGKYSFLDLPLKGGICALDTEAGVIVFTVSGDAMHTIFNRSSSVMPLHEELFTVDALNRTAWALANKFINYRWENPNKEHQLIISVKSLLSACATALPKEEELKAQGASTKQKIVKPFVKALSHLTEEAGVLEYWEFCHAKNEDLTEEEQQALLDSNGEETVLPNYSFFKTLYVRYALLHDNEEFRQKRLAGRVKQAEALEAAKQKNEEEKDKSRKRIQRDAEKKAAADLAEDLKKALT